MRMKRGHTAVSDIESTSVALKTWRKEPEKHTARPTVGAKTSIKQIKAVQEINLTFFL